MSELTNLIADNSTCRELAESSERIEGLENEVNSLLAALRAISLDPSFNAVEHQEVIDILTRVRSIVSSRQTCTKLA